MERAPARWPLPAFFRASSFLGFASALACAETEGLGLDGGWADAGLVDGGSIADAGPIEVVRLRGNLATTNEQAVMTTPLPGATVCQTHPIEGPCAISEANGAYELEVVADAEVLLEIAAPELPNYLLPLRTGAVDGNLNVPLLPLGVVADWGALTGGSLDPRRGILIVQVAAPDVTVTLSPDDARVRAYTDAAGGVPNPGLPRSSPHGFAIFLDVPPGEHTVRVEHPTRSCRRGLGWPGPSDNLAGGPIRAGQVTRLTIACRAQ